MLTLPARPLPHRLSCLAACVALVKRCVTMYSTLPASRHVTGPLRDLLALHRSRSGCPPELQVRTGPRPDTRVRGPVRGAPLHVGVLGRSLRAPTATALLTPGPVSERPGRNGLAEAELPAHGLRADQAAAAEAVHPAAGQSVSAGSPWLGGAGRAAGSLTAVRLQPGVREEAGPHQGRAGAAAADP